MYCETIQETANSNELPMSSGCLSEFQDTTPVDLHTATYMRDYQFHLVPCKAAKGVIMQVLRSEQLILSTHLPSAFSRGELRAACMQAGGREYLIFVAHAAARANGAGRHWFAIFGADGRKVYVSSLDQRIARARQNQDGISLFFVNGDAIRIRL
jgi:hypothetical protein